MNLNTYPGKLISFEGPRGSGKTTQAERMRSVVEQQGYPAVLSFQQEGEDWGFGSLVQAELERVSSVNLREEISSLLRSHAYLQQRLVMNEPQKCYLKVFECLAGKILEGENGPRTKFFLLCMIFEWQQKMSRIIPWLGQNKIVIIKQYFPQILAYALANNLSWDATLKACEAVLGNMFIIPDAVIFMDVPERISIARAYGKHYAKINGTRLWEEVSEFRKAFLLVMDRLIYEHNLKVVRIDGESRPDLVSDVIIRETETDIKRLKILV